MTFQTMELSRSILKKLAGVREALDVLYNTKKQYEQQLEDCRRKIKAKEDYLAQYNLSKKIQKEDSIDTKYNMEYAPNSTTNWLIQEQK